MGGIIEVLVFLVILGLISVIHSPRYLIARALYDLDRKLWRQIVWRHRRPIARAAMLSIGQVLASIFALVFVFGIWALIVVAVERLK